MGGFSVNGNISLNIGGGGPEELLGGPLNFLGGGGQNNGVGQNGAANWRPQTGQGGFVNRMPTPRLPPIGNDLRSQLMSALSDLFGALGKLMGGSGFGGGHCGNPGQVSPPNPQDCLPCGNGGLKTDASGCVTTPGGYKIESTGKFDWKITDPSGKESTITGDPHVKDGDGTKFDFKRDSTFMLPDGTKIDVTTAPYGNDMTVTKGLSITNGNDRVQMTDIDQGKGKTGEVTKDGFDHVNDFAGKDVFVMGKDGNDFFLNGKEVVGSENGGDSFKFGDKKPDIGNGGQMNDMAQQFMQLLTQLLQMLGLGGQGDEFALQGGQGGGQGMFDGNGGDNLFAMGNQNGGANGANQNGFAEGEPNPNAPNQQQGRGLQNGLGALIQLFQALSRIASLLEQLNQGRQPQGQLM